MTTATLAAKERQLDWLLDEVLGPAHAAARARHHWLVAALIALAVGTAFGVAWLREDRGARSAQEREDALPWIEVHGGAAGIPDTPADARAVRCFDFDDDAIERLVARCPDVEHLDFGHMDLNDRGYAVSLKVTDAGVAHLGKLRKLRSLALGQCHEMKGEGLRVLEAVPLLESLDVTYSGIESPAVERLSRLGSLRELTLSHCMNFRGSSLAEVAKIAGLRTLRLQACTTISAKDALQLVNAKGLRHLDLRDCQGRFRGQRMSTGLGDDVQEAPVEDGIGITDDVVAALSVLPLETLLLGGSESLTDAIGESFAKMPTLRGLDVSNLPKTTGALLPVLPTRLQALWLDDNPQFEEQDLLRVPAMPDLRTLGLAGLSLQASSLEHLLADASLTHLRLGAVSPAGKGDLLRKQLLGRKRLPEPLPAVAATHIARQTDLTSLEIRDGFLLDRAFLTTIAPLPRLTHLDLSASSRLMPLGSNDALKGLAANRSLSSLKVMWCRFDADTLRAWARMPLRQLDLFGTNVTDAEVVDAAAAWPGCVIKMPRGQRYVVPATR
ncbi:MAG: hypothetical protein JNK78_01800 [Planctomycetes bacterium]|nr:hypothetical protein [Planctomycetota bacterium]